MTSSVTRSSSATEPPTLRTTAPSPCRPGSAPASTRSGPARGSRAATRSPPAPSASRNTRATLLGFACGRARVFRRQHARRRSRGPWRTYPYSQNGRAATGSRRAIPEQRTQRVEAGAEPRLQRARSGGGTRRHGCEAGTGRAGGHRARTSAGHRRRSRGRGGRAPCRCGGGCGGRRRSCCSPPTWLVGGRDRGRCRAGSAGRAPARRRLAAQQRQQRAAVEDPAVAGRGARARRRRDRGWSRRGRGR